VVAKKRQANLANKAEADSRAMAFTDVQVRLLSTCYYATSCMVVVGAVMGEIQALGIGMAVGQAMLLL
jgi:hypothetical protein